MTDFFDTLGIGSFATTTSLFKLGRVVDDAHIPGTLNVGHTCPTFAQAFIYIAVVEVEMSTLVLMIGAAVAGRLAGRGLRVALAAAARSRSAWACCCSSRRASSSRA